MSTVGYGITYRHHYLICTKVLPVGCLYETVPLSVLFGNSSCTITLFWQSFSFELKKNTIRVLF